MGRSLTEMVPRRGLNRLVVADALMNHGQRAGRGVLRYPPDTWYAEVCRRMIPAGQRSYGWWSLPALQEDGKNLGVVKNPNPDPRQGMDTRKVRRVARPGA